MRVGLDLLYLIPGETGGRETYARELVPAMLERSPELELVAFVNRDAGIEFVRELGARVRPVVVPISARSRGQWAAGELLFVSIAAQRARVEVLHSMANFAPPWGHFARVVTVHDLQYRALSEQLSAPLRALTGAMVSLATRHADRVITDSMSTRDDLIGLLGLASAGIDVVPLGLGTGRAAQPVAQKEVRARFRLGDRRVALSVATNLPHKNLGVLIEALALMPSATRPMLVLAGHATDDGSLRDRAAASGIADDVRAIGTCSAGELDALYETAGCLVMPSLHEGFGLPALEAMTRSLPVACSDIAALREVADHAAVYFDPRKPAEIAARIDELLVGGAVAQHLRQLGHARALTFSWQATAEATLASYRRAVGGRA